MTKIYTLTLAPSLDSATLTPQMYPEGKLRAAHRFSNPAAAVSTSHVPSPFSVVMQRPSTRPVAPPANTLRRYSLQNRSRLSLSKRKTGRGKICMCTWAPAANNTAS